MRRLIMQNSKKGVSLVVVLLFMLVATIAATATYRWLTAQSKASASRMVQSEAYQSAVAGIEAARSWMTFHGNDLGGIIKQYFDDAKKPILLDSALQNINRRGQRYNVWLVGVDVTSTEYKLKIVSQGVARNGSKHSEVAVLNVSGLYRVQIPSEELNVNFDKAFYGQITNMTNSPTVESAIINGDLSGNQPSVSEHLLVTGKATLGGESKLAGADLYVGGDVEFNSKTVIGGASDSNVAYIGGNITTCAGGPVTVGGDLYVGGNIAANCEISCTGNLTINGILYRSTENKTVTIAKNMVFTENGTISLNGDNAGSQFAISGNSYLPKTFEGWGDGNGNRKANLGSTLYTYTDKSFQFCSPNGTQNGVFNEYYYGIYSQCNELTNNSLVYNDVQYRYLSYKSTSANSRIGGTQMSSWSRTDNVLKFIGDDYWENLDKMDEYGNLIDASENTVPIPILLSNKSAWISKTANSRCVELGYSHVNKPITNMMNSNGTNDVYRDINECYQELVQTNDDILYNGFMVVEFSGNSTTNMSQNVGVILNGNFIFYYNSPIGALYLPPTTAGSTVFLYLEQGGGTIFSAGGSSNNDDYNYFVYSDKDIAFSKAKINGSVVMANGAKATISDGENKLKYNASVLSALAQAGIISENPDYTSRLNGGSGSSSGGSVTVDSYDSYYVAIAPQLGISLISQYRNNELDVADLDEDDYSEIKPSILVLPRVIYLTQDPVGSLEDYYNVINLNGATETKTPSRASCSPTLPTNTKLYQNGVLLDEDIYTCTYESSTNGNSSFYVVVSGLSSSNPTVKLKSPYVEVSAGGSADINLIVPSSDVAQTISVDVLAPDMPDGWTFVASSNVKLVSGNLYTAEVSLQDVASTIPLFTVNVSDASSQGTATFQLMSPCDGCTIGTPDMETVYISGTATVNRADLEAYCGKYPENCPTDGEYAKALKRPSCSDLLESDEVWVKASGMACRTTSANEQWECGLNLSISLNRVLGYPENYCDLFLPTVNNTIDAPEDGKAYSLYADLKRKAYNLHVDLTGENAKPVSLYTSAKSGVFESTADATCSDVTNGCDFTVYAGYYVKLAVEDDKDFSYWKCYGEDCMNPTETGNPLYMLITSANTVEAHFGETDKHCFYDSFESASLKSDSALWTGDLATAFDIADSRIALQSGAAESGYAQLISTKQAGTTGTLKTLFQTQIVTDDESDETALNSGFMLRSNSAGTNYFILNVFGKGSDGYLHARLCKAMSKNLTSKATCKDQALKDSEGNAVSITTESQILMTVSMAQAAAKTSVSSTSTSSTLSLSMEVGFGGLNSSNTKTISTTFDLSSLFGTTWNDSEHEYVGFKLADEAFKIYDIGWKSEAYADSCWATYPTASCSFKANYLGGIVPKDTDVKPWVTLSSWFDKQNCEPLYLYNEYVYGGRNSASLTKNEVYGPYYYQPTNNRYEFYWIYDGYNFNTEGMYGYEATTVYTYYNYWTGKLDTVTYTGKHYDAAVKIYCPNQTLRYHSESKYASYTAGRTSCGSFYVGKMHACSENALFDVESQQIFAGSETTISTKNSAVVNVRDASLYLSLDNSYGATITVRFIDENGNRSLPISTSKTGTATFSANTMLATNASSSQTQETYLAESFDPQKVVGIVISTTNTFTLVSAGTTCPNAMNISNCSVSYNGSSWLFNALITNASSAKTNGCSITGDFGSGNAPAAMDCPTTSPAEFAVEDAGVYESLNTEKTYSFDIVVESDNDKISCTAETTLYPAELICDISTGTVTAGSGTVPTLNYQFTNCPNGGCTYTVSLTGPGVSEKTSGTFSESAAQSWSPTNLNNTASSPLQQGIYTYTLNSMNLSNRFCSQTFEVTESVNPEVTSCSVTSTGAFTAAVSNVSDLTYSYTLQVADNLGNVISGKTLSGSSNTKNFSGTITPPTAAGDYNYVLNVTYEGASSTCQATLEVQAESSSSAFVSSSSGAVTATCKLYNNSNEEIVSAFTGTSNLYLSVTHDASSNTQAYFSGTVAEWNGSANADVEKTSESLWLNANQNATRYFTAPVTAGIYTYSVSLNGSQLCAATLELTDALTCAAPTTVNAGKSFALTGTYSGTSCAKGWTRNLSGTGTEWPGELNCTSLSQNFTAPSTPGSYQYVMYVEGSPNANCTKTVTVEQVPPTFACPSNAKASIGASDNVKLALTGVTGCAEGGNYCLYSITGDGNISVSGNSYTGGTLPVFTDNTVTSEDSKSYTVRLTNSAGSVEHACSVEFTAGSSNRVIDSDVMKFTVTNGETFCFENHNRPATYNTKAQVNCGQCQGNDCSGTFDGSSVGAYAYFSKYMTVVNNVFSGCITINWSGDQSGDTQRECNIYAY